MKLFHIEIKKKPHIIITTLTSHQITLSLASSNVFQNNIEEEIIKQIPFEINNENAKEPPEERK